MYLIETTRDSGDVEVTVSENEAFVSYILQPDTAAAGQTFRVWNLDLSGPQPTTRPIVRQDIDALVDPLDLALSVAKAAKARKVYEDRQVVLAERAAEQEADNLQRQAERDEREASRLLRQADED